MLKCRFSGSGVKILISNQLPGDATGPLATTEQVWNARLQANCSPTEPEAVLHRNPRISLMPTNDYTRTDVDYKKGCDPWLQTKQNQNPSLVMGMHVCMQSHFSHVQIFAALWTLTHQATLSIGFSRQEYWYYLIMLNTFVFSSRGRHCFYLPRMTAYMSFALDRYPTLSSKVLNTTNILKK